MERMSNTQYLEIIYGVICFPFDVSNGAHPVDVYHFLSGKVLANETC